MERRSKIEGNTSMGRGYNKNIYGGRKATRCEGRHIWIEGIRYE